MSADEDTELRDLVAQTLEANGVLGKIRAQLRASVFLALEEQESIQNKTPFLNAELQKFLSTEEGCNAVLLIKEFLQFFRLDYTLAVFEPELSCSSEKLEYSRSVLSRQLGLAETSETAKLPLIASVVRQCESGGSNNGRLPSLKETSRLDQDQDSQMNSLLPASLVSEAKNKFVLYDKDGSGQIDKNELRELFCGLFPDFHRNMLDRYVNDEFRSADKDFSNGIDFEEFLEIYQRLFIRCKSSVAEKIQDLVQGSPRSSKNGFEARVTEKNGVNVAQTAAALPAGSGKSKPDTKDASAGRKNSSGSDVDSDSFFDDRFFEKSKPQDKKEEPKSSGPVAGKASGTSLSSLADLPSLSNGRPTAVSKKDEIKDGSEIIDLEYEDDKYEDDFQGSNISPLGQTPRSARSDKNVRSIENDEIDEEIEEDLSLQDDPLKSDRSFIDDLTTDRTVSPAEQSTAGDYVENVLYP